MASFVRDVRVGVERDVRNRIALADEELPIFEVRFHDSERIAPAR